MMPAHKNEVAKSVRYGGEEEETIYIRSSIYHDYADGDDEEDDDDGATVLGATDKIF